MNGYNLALMTRKWKWVNLLLTCTEGPKLSIPILEAPGSAISLRSRSVGAQLAKGQVMCQWHRDPRHWPPPARLLGGPHRAGQPQGMTLGKSVLSHPVEGEEVAPAESASSAVSSPAVHWRRNFFLTLFFLCTHPKPSRPFEGLFC